MADSSTPNLAAVLEQLECSRANIRELEAQLQAQRQEAAERADQLEKRVAEGADQLHLLGTRVAALQQELAVSKEETQRLARCAASGEAAQQALASTSTGEELRSLRRRLRYYENDEGEELLLFVARRLLETWDAKTQCSVLMATKATHAELLPRVTRAVLTMTWPCSLVGAIGLRELTLDLYPEFGDANYVGSAIASWSHLTGLRVLTIRRPLDEDYDYAIHMEFPASISNLASLSEMHLRQMNAMGLHHLSALSQLASLHVIDCPLQFDAVPVLPSLQVLHVKDTISFTMQHFACQPNLTKLHLVGDVDNHEEGTWIQQFEEVAVLTRLQELVLRNCTWQTNNLEALAPLTALTQLILHSTDVTSLQPLTTLKQLRVFYLSRMLVVRDLAPLTHLTALEHLDMRTCGDGAADASPLTALTGLKTINITNCFLRNMERLDDMQQLTVR